MSEKADRESWDVQRFKENCFLSSLWRPLANLHKVQVYGSMAEESRNKRPRTRKGLGGREMGGINEGPETSYLEYITQIDCDDPEILTNFLTARKGQKDFFYLDNRIFSLLIPKIRFYKISTEGAPKNGKYKYGVYMVPFPGSTLGENSLKDGEKFPKEKENLRNTFGIKSFDVTTEGTNPSTIDRFLTANLSIYFNNMNDLFITRQFPYTGGDSDAKQSIDGRIIDLITLYDTEQPEQRKQSGDTTEGADKSESKRDAEKDIEDFYNNLIIASVGWSPPTVGAIARTLRIKPAEAQRIRDSIKANDVKYVLNMQNFKFDLKQDGTGVLNIEYGASLDTAYGSRFFDILGAEPSEEEISKAEKQISESAADDEKAAVTLANIKANLNDKLTSCFKALQADWRQNQTKTSGKEAHKETKKCGQNIRLSKEDIEQIQRLKSKEAKKLARELRNVKPNWSDNIDVNKLKESISPNNIWGFLKNAEKLKNIVNLIASAELRSAIKDGRSPEQIRHEYIARYKIRKYRDVINNLYEDGKVYFINIDKTLYRSWRTWSNGGNLGYSIKENGEYKFKNYKDLAKDNKDDLVSDQKCYVRDKATGIKIHNIKKCLEEESSLVLQPKPLNVRRVNFVYFADIIDAAIKSIFDSNLEIAEDEEDLKRKYNIIRDQLLRKKIVIGNILLEDKLTEKTTSNVYSVNLGDIPISLHSYSVWFQKRAANFNVKQWSLLNFILDCAGSLLSNGLGFGCSSRANNHSIIRTTMFTSEFKDRDKGQTKIGNQQRIYLDGKAIDCLDEEDVSQCLTQRKHKSSKNHIGFWEDPAGRLTGTELSIGEEVDTFYIFGDSFSGEILEGSEEKDSKKGIYYFNLGSQQGIVKKINYKLEDIEQLRAARIVRATDENNVGNQIILPYNVDIDMFGCTLMQPGMFLYIRPDLPGISKMEEEKGEIFRERIGLGGYYQIMNVKHTFNGYNFSTSLSCRQQSNDRDVRTEVNSQGKIGDIKNIDFYKPEIKLTLDNEEKKYYFGKS